MFRMNKLLRSLISLLPKVLFYLFTLVICWVFDINRSSSIFLDESGDESDSKKSGTNPNASGSGWGASTHTYQPTYRGGTGIPGTGESSQASVNKRLHELALRSISDRMAEDDAKIKANNLHLKSPEDLTQDEQDLLDKRERDARSLSILSKDLASLNIASPSNNPSTTERAEGDVIKRSADFSDLDSSKKTKR